MATPKPFKFGPNQKKWLHMLETTKRKQARGQLFDGKGYCCLGIACVSLGVKPEKRDGVYFFAGDQGILSSSLRKKIGLRESAGSPVFGTGLDALTEYNDRKKWSFKKIAKHLRENPRAYFSRSK